MVSEYGWFGDWEIDTVMGRRGRGTIVTLVKRTTGFQLMGEHPWGKETAVLADAVIQLLSYTG